MTSALMRRAVPLVAGCALISSCYVATHFAGWQYRGGPLVNNGLFSRPRFEAYFPAISLNVPGSYEYTFSRFPATDGVVVLAGQPPVTSIERLTTRVRFRVVDQDSPLQCDATGSPRGQGDEQLMIHSSFGRVIDLWLRGCARLQLRTCNPCRLIIAVGPVDPATPGALFVPTILGGGAELP